MYICFIHNLISTSMRRKQTLIWWYRRHNYFLLASCLCLLKTISSNRASLYIYTVFSVKRDFCVVNQIKFLFESKPYNGKKIQFEYFEAWHLYTSTVTLLIDWKLLEIKVLNGDKYKPFSDLVYTWYHAVGFLRPKQPKYFWN